MALSNTWLSTACGYTPLSLVGLLALADIDSVARRTALTGTASWLDALILCPGLHRQHRASNLSNGEFPACAAMTTGYVFRIENPATVAYLQSVSRTGQLTTLKVSKENGTAPKEHAALRLAALSTVAAIAYMAFLRDWPALAYMSALVLIRLVNIFVIKSQACVDWHGQQEPGETSDLFALLSYDRWVRIRGGTDDTKAVTSGRWLREPTAVENAVIGCGTLLSYLAPCLVVNATFAGQVIIAVMLVGNAISLEASNRSTVCLRMKDRVLQVEGMRESYGRRRVLADKLISESGRKDWALAMGLIPWAEADQAEGSMPPHPRGPVTM